MMDHDDVWIGYRERIVVDPHVLVGKPIVRGTRISVSKILNLVGNGFTPEQIVEDYPVLKVDDIKAAILYAGERLDHPEPVPAALLT